MNHARHAEPAGSAPRPRSRVPANVFAAAQDDRLVMQDFRRFPESIEWELGRRYLAERGSCGFTADSFPIPHAVHNDGFLSTNAAQLLFANMLAADEAGGLEGEIFVLELGLGIGLFVRLFLDAFRSMCTDADKDYHERLRYVAGDFSERMLLDACLHGVFANHPGRYALRIVDALDPAEGLRTELSMAEIARPFRAVFLNYLLDCLPATVLKFRGQESGIRSQESEVAELYVRSCLARGENLAEYTDLSAEEIAYRANEGSAAEKAELYGADALFTSEYEFRRAELPSVPYGEFARQFAQSSGCEYVWHSYGAIQSLERLLTLLHGDGFILFNDYGHTDPQAGRQFEHQRMSRSTFIGLNFSELKAYFAPQTVVPPGSPLAPQSSPLAWEEPAEDNGSVYARLLGHRLGSETRKCFRERFSKQAYEDIQEPVQVARSCLQAGAIDSAATAYRRALEKQPLNWMLMSEAAKFLTFTFKNPEAGAVLSREALKLNPACSAELWNTYGDSLFLLGWVEEARQAFERVLRINPGDARACYNLSFVRQQQKDYGGALEAIARGLLHDGAGEFREGLLQKQAEIVRYVESRHKQECMLQANRVNRDHSVSRKMKNEERKMKNEE